MVRANPATRIFPSGWMATLLATSRSEDARDDESVPGRGRNSCRASRWCCSATTAKAVLLTPPTVTPVFPTTTILPSGWIATP